MLFILFALLQIGAVTVFAVVGATTLELLVLPLPVAICWCKRHRVLAISLVGISVIPLFLLNMPLNVIAYIVFVSLLGIIIGLGVEKKWTYGWIVTLCTASAFTVGLVDALTSWEGWIAEGRRISEQYRMMAATPTNLPETDGVNEMQTWLQWLLVEHWKDLGLGMLFASTLLMVCFGVSLCVFLLRRMNYTECPLGRLAEMRPPEWLVWIAIGLSLLWFLDYGKPELGLRPFVWNSAVAIAAIYWLNGFSIALFLAAMSSSVLMYILIITTIVLLGGYVIFFVGLFDTWIDFRKRFTTWHQHLMRLQKPDA